MILDITLLTKLLIVLFISVLIFVFYLIIKKIILKKNTYNLLKSNEHMGYKLIEAKGKDYQYVLRTEEFDIYLKVISVPKNSQVCINSKDTWNLNYQFFKKENGRAYANSRYLDELKNYLYNDIKTNRTYLKVVMLYKHVDNIIRYLNESELDVVTISDSPYGYKITSYNTFEKDLDILLINKK